MKRRTRKRAGGLLIGPSHEQGGILATTPGMPDVELEGGEYIINAQTVNALGTEFLDQLNSTQTTYHTGGFGAGELPSPSNYRRGGVIRKKRRGGRARKMPHGGPHGRNGNNMVMMNGRNRRMRSMLTGYRRGGNVKRMPHGGPHAMANQFRNRRTGQMVSAGTAYHVHPEQGPMEGAVHNPNIPGGTAGHDYFDRVNGRMSGYRQGGRIKRMPHGGPHNGNGNGIASTNECPHGNRSVNHLGQTICI